MAKAHASSTNQRSRTKASPAAKHSRNDLRQRVLADLATLHVPLDEERFDEHLSRAEQEGLTPLEFFARIVGEEANRRRERSIEPPTSIGYRSSAMCALSSARADPCAANMCALNRR